MSRPQEWPGSGEIPFRGHMQANRFRHFPAKCAREESSSDLLVPIIDVLVEIVLAVPMQKMAHIMQ